MEAENLRPRKRAKTCPANDLVTLATAPASPAAAEDHLTSLPEELLLIIKAKLSQPRDLHAFRTTCRYVRDILNKTADTLTLTADLAQFLLFLHPHAYLHQAPRLVSSATKATNASSNRRFTTPTAAAPGAAAAATVAVGNIATTAAPTTTTHQHPLHLPCLHHPHQQPQPQRASTISHPCSTWLEQLLAKFPSIVDLSVRCPPAALLLFSRRLLDMPGGGGAERALGFAAHMKSLSRRHGAILLCELMKAKVAAGEYTEALELADTINKQASQRGASHQDGYRYARDSVDDALSDIVCLLQWWNAKTAAEFAKKIKAPARAAATWRWLFYFLAKQRQPETAIEGYKLVDKAALQVLSPTCISELFRTLIDSEIANQAEVKLKALTSESGSWTKFMYRGNFNLTSVQSREGAMEKVCCELMLILYLDTAVNFLNKLESDSTAQELWLQLVGMQGISRGAEVLAPPLLSMRAIASDQGLLGARAALHAVPAAAVILPAVPPVAVLPTAVAPVTSAAHAAGASAVPPPLGAPPLNSSAAGQILAASVAGAGSGVASGSGTGGAAAAVNGGGTLSASAAAANAALVATVTAAVANASSTAAINGMSAAGKDVAAAVAMVPAAVAGPSAVPAVDRLLQLAFAVADNRKAAAYGEVIKVLVQRGDVSRALQAAEQVPDHGADAGLWLELRTVLALDACLTASLDYVCRISHRTQEVLQQVAARLSKPEVVAQVQLCLVRIHLLRGDFATARHTAQAMSNLPSAVADEQAAWAAICFASLALKDSAGVVACLSSMTPHTLLFGSAVLGGGPLWSRVCNAVVEMPHLPPPQEQPFCAADDAEQNPTAATDTAAHVVLSGGRLQAGQDVATLDSLDAALEVASAEEQAATGMEVEQADEAHTRQGGKAGSSLPTAASASTGRNLRRTTRAKLAAANSGVGGAVAPAEAGGSGTTSQQPAVAQAVTGGHQQQQQQQAGVRGACGTGGRGKRRGGGVHGGKGGARAVLHAVRRRLLTPPHSNAGGGCDGDNGDSSEPEAEVEQAAELGRSGAAAAAGGSNSTATVLGGGRRAGSVRRRSGSSSDAEAPPPTPRRTTVPPPQPWPVAALLHAVQLMRSHPEAIDESVHEPLIETAAETLLAHQFAEEAGKLARTARTQATIVNVLRKVVVHQLAAGQVLQAWETLIFIRALPAVDLPIAADVMTELISRLQVQGFLMQAKQLACANPKMDFGNNFDTALTKLCRALVTAGRMEAALEVAEHIYSTVARNLELDHIARKSLAKNLQLAIRAARQISGQPCYKTSFTWRDIANRALSKGELELAGEALHAIPPSDKVRWDTTVDTESMWRAVATAWTRRGNPQRAASATAEAIRVGSTGGSGPSAGPGMNASGAGDVGGNHRGKGAQRGPGRAP